MQTSSMFQWQMEEIVQSKGTQQYKSFDTKYASKAMLGIELEQFDEGVM